jgi:hypothetical protein
MSRRARPADNRRPTCASSLGYLARRREASVSAASARRIEPSVGVDAPTVVHPQPVPSRCWSASASFLPPDAPAPGSRCPPPVAPPVQQVPPSARAARGIRRGGRRPALPRRSPVGRGDPRIAPEARDRCARARAAGRGALRRARPPLFVQAARPLPELRSAPHVRRGRDRHRPHPAQRPDSAMGDVAAPGAPRPRRAEARGLERLGHRRTLAQAPGSGFPHGDARSRGVVQPSAPGTFTRRTPHTRRPPCGCTHSAGHISATDQAASKSRLSWPVGSRARARGKGSARRPRWRRIFLATAGSVMVAMGRSLPSQAGHARASMPCVAGGRPTPNARMTHRARLRRGGSNAPPG